jgi:hypothetical protein
MNADLKVSCLVAGMTAGADSIDDMDVLRHGAMPVLFGGVRAPSTLGTFLRSFTWGNARQLEAAGRRFLAELARQVPLLPGKDVVAFVDIDSQQNGCSATASRVRRSAIPRSAARACWSAA